MSNYPCRLIEDLIPLYIEGDVSDETKEIVEEHIKECESCRMLIKDYSNDEIKLDSYEEDIPLTSTFKKYMKSLKAWITFAIIAILSIIISIGSIGYKMGQAPKNDFLTAKTIVNTFEKQGVHLEKDNSKSPDSFKINGVKPAVFRVGKTEDNILIYTFRSFVERENIVKDANELNTYSAEKIPYNVKNTLIVYVPSKNPKSEDEMKDIYEIRGTVSDIIFKYLNDGKEIVYKGESTHWEGTVTLRYYEHWWQDEKGKLYYESYHTESPLLKYKMADIKDVGLISYDYKTTSGGGNGTGMRLDDNGCLKIGGGGGNGALPRENDDYNITIKWNGQEESFTLKAQK